MQHVRVCTTMLVITLSIKKGHKMSQTNNYSCIKKTPHKKWNDTANTEARCKWMQDNFLRSQITLKWTEICAFFIFTRVARCSECELLVSQETQTCSVFDYKSKLVEKNNFMINMDHTYEFWISQRQYSVVVSASLFCLTAATFC